MKRFHKVLTSMALLFMLTNSVEAANISLPTPNISQSKMLTEVLNERHSSRDLYGNLTLAQISKILWAANGITNRMVVGGTVEGHVNPAAMGIYAVDVYAVTSEGIYLYKPETHSLELVRKGDYRATTTLGQDFAKTAPLNLVYVEKITKWGDAPEVMERDVQLACAYIAAGSMSQSVSLMANSEALGTCVRGSINVAEFTKAAKLSSNQKILLAQSIGESHTVAKG